MRAETFGFWKIIGYINVLQFLLKIHLISLGILVFTYKSLRFQWVWRQFQLIIHIIIYQSGFHQWDFR